jgi:hypothetical protein
VQPARAARHLLKSARKPLRVVRSKPVTGRSNVDTDISKTVTLDRDDMYEAQTRLADAYLVIAERLSAETPFVMSVQTGG